MKKRRNKHILIIHTDGNTFNNPSLKSIIDLLLDNNFKIDLRYPKSNAPMPLQEGVRFIPFGKLVKFLKNIIFNRILLSLFMQLSVLIEYVLYYKKYDLIVGVDRQGLIEANILNKLFKIPFIYMSFEIFFEKETSSKFKYIEKISSKNISRWIVQDEVRAQKLKEENSLYDDKKFILPLASAGKGNISDTRLRDRLGIPKDKNVAIVIGSIASPWSMTRQVVKSVFDWPENWVLILHERYGRTRQYLEREFPDLEKVISEKIFISESATEMVDDMSMVLSGVDVGFAFYKPNYSGPYTGDNLKYLGFASGKISTYLRYGIPVIVNEIGLFAEEVRKHNLGVVVVEPDKISDELRLIKKNIRNENIYNYFSKKLDFNVYREDVLSVFLLAMAGK